MKALRDAVLAGLAGMALSLALYGYSGAGNAQHRQFRPWLERRLDPALYPGDAFVDSVERVPSVFWRASASALQAAGLEPETYFYAVYLVALTALFGSVHLLAAALAGPAAGAAAVALALLSNHLHFFSLLAHDAMLRDWADQTLLSWVAALVALRLRVGGRYAAAGVSLGLGFLANPFIAASTTAALLLGELPAVWKSRSGWGPLRLAGAFLLVGAPVWVQVLRLPAPAIPDAEWASLLRDWFPLHYFPSSWSPAQWLYIALHGGAFAALYVLGFRSAPGGRELLRFGGGLLALWAGSALFAEVWPVRVLILFQAFRLDVLATLLALIAAAAAMPRLAAAPGGWAWLGLAWAGLANPHRTLLPLGLLLPVFAWWAYRPEKAAAPGPGLRTWLGVVGVASAVRLFEGLRVSSLYPIESAALVAAFIGLGLFAPRAKRSAAALAFASALVAGLELRQARKAYARIAEPGLSEPARVEAWLRTNTPPDARIVAAPLYEDVRLGARRTVVVEPLDGAAMHWDPDFGPGWKRRMQDHGWRFDVAAAGWRYICLQRFPLLQRETPGFDLIDAWDEARVRRLIETYRPDYVVSPFGPAKGLVPEAAFDRLTVYRVEKRVQ